MVDCLICTVLEWYPDCPTIVHGFLLPIGSAIEIENYFHPPILDDVYQFSGVGGGLVGNSHDSNWSVLKDYQIHDVSLNYPCLWTILAISPCVERDHNRVSNVKAGSFNDTLYGSTFVVLFGKLMERCILPLSVKIHSDAMMHWRKIKDFYLFRSFISCMGSRKALRNTKWKHIQSFTMVAHHMMKDPLKCALAGASNTCNNQW